MAPRRKFSREIPLYVMLAPAVVLALVYAYAPMVGIVMAFQRVLPGKGIFGSPWVGLDNFAFVLRMPNILQVLWNTIRIAGLKAVAGVVVPVTVALMLNNVTSQAFKRTVQTIVYLPHFLSWVILAGIFIDILSPSGGVVNHLLGLVGIPPIFFLGNDKVFPWTMVATDVWKSFGFGAIVYLAALTDIDPTLYEAAVMDGASRRQQTRHVTLPGISGTIIMLSTLSLGNILNAGFDQIFNLYSPLVYRTGDIIDTLVYRIGIVNFQYGVATAVGLFKSVVSLLLIGIAYKLAAKWADYRIF
ncbi:MAG TPA: ABC transporter permease subunit [Anaerolineae bacterium]|nr:ABC transporter permease subunit [Anaerolineae bacterium]HQI85597.1 ABC transporter permease subunit [Anaerolineae bacterium]